MKISPILKNTVLLLAIVLLIILIFAYSKPLLNAINQPTVDANNNLSANNDTTLLLKGYEELQTLFPDQKLYPVKSTGFDYTLAEIGKKGFWCPDYYSFFKTNKLGETFYPDTLTNTPDDVPSFLAVDGMIFRYHRNRTKTLADHKGDPIIENWNNDYEFTWLTDKSGNALFKSQDKFYRYDNLTGQFFESELPSGDIEFLSFTNSYYSPLFLGYNTDITELERFEENGLIGYKNEDDEIIGANYKMSFGFSERVAALYNGNEIHLYNENGERLLENTRFVLPNSSGINLLGFYRLENGLMRVCVSDEKSENSYERTIFITGDDFLTPDDSEVISYSNGIFLLKNNDGYTYYTADGMNLNDNLYELARPFSEGLAVVQINGKKGMINALGELVISAEWDEICDCSGGVITLFDQETKWHIVNKISNDK